MREGKSYLQRYAMLFGTYMGVFWILKFILFPIGLTVPFLLLLFGGLTLCVPFIGYYYARIYRERICGGSISFFHSWVFIFLMYMFAALLTAVGHYFYFKFIDQGFVFNKYEDIINSFTAIDVPGIEDYIDQLKEGLKMMRSMSAIEVAMQLMSQNIFYCSILALITSLFVMKRRRK
ncbi:MAG: DUF4199 domain-containing protein [Bacteroides sp.]|jgi:hypothetical protein|nr:DUF4199 domain-containing protein [Bacteroides sp.]